ncbi:hypothetical protein Lepto7375DRAFT_1842 [Leptolyngbya sp. PCC 7375]|nr:hypothetical protein Lepto7375DRAFT_1842 [Leptolyngbya sp. PCC 7375]
MHIVFSKFSKDETTQRVLKREKIGGVISIWTGKIQEVGYDDIDQKIETAKYLGIPIHLHPVQARYDRKGQKPYKIFWETLELSKEIINRYSGVTTRLTIANELIVSPAEVWAEIIRLYAWTVRHHPRLQLWIGDYGIYDTHRRRQIISRLKELKTAMPAVHGFIGQDYVDLDTGSAISRSLKSPALGVNPLLKFQYLNEFIPRIKSLGYTFALEHSTFSRTDTKARRKTQASIYNCLSKLCHRTQSEFWLWDCCDASAKHVRTLEPRFAGSWDAGGQPKFSDGTSIEQVNYI